MCTQADQLHVPVQCLTIHVLNFRNVITWATEWFWLSAASLCSYVFVATILHVPASIPVIYSSGPFQYSSSPHCKIDSIWLPKLPTSYASLNTVESHCLLYIPTVTRFSITHFANDILQWCGNKIWNWGNQKYPLFLAPVVHSSLPNKDSLKCS